MPETLSQIQESLGGFDQYGFRSTRGAGACIACQAQKSVRCVVFEKPPCLLNSHARKRDPTRCRSCVRLHSKCELVDGRLPCKKCLVAGRECVLQEPRKPKAAEASVSQISMEATTTPRDVPRKGGAQPRNTMPCVSCKIARCRCEMINGRPPCTRCRRSGQTCVHKAHDEPAKASRPNKAVSTPSTRKSVPQRTTDATAIATPAACTSCQAQKAQCEIVGQPPCTECRRGNHECMCEKEVAVPEKGVSCLQCPPSEPCVMGSGPPCNRCHAKGQKCVPRDLIGDVPAQNSLPKGATADTTEICGRCQTWKARCEVIGKPPCTECRRKHRKCSLNALPLPSFDANFLLSEISDLTSLPSSPRLPRRMGRRGSSDTETTSDTDSRRSLVWSIKSEKLQSPMPMNQIPASEHHENIAPIGHAVDGGSVATQPTQILHTESATTQPNAPEPELSQHDGNRASNGLGVSELSDTTRPTQIPPPEPATTQPAASELEVSENDDNPDSTDNPVNGTTSATQQTQNPRIEPATIQPPASGFEPFLSTSLDLHVSEFGQTIVSGLSRPSEEVLDLWWDNCNFVRDGWLTAQEAVTYLDLFSQYLAPFSYIISQDFLSHKSHDQLLKEDPILCCTLLVISSRFFVLPGPGGLSRSHSIHNHLWKHYEVFTQRVLCGDDNYFAAKSRVLGVIESLMLISDWHPRSFQLPHDNLDWAEMSMQERDRHKVKQKNRDPTSIQWQEDVFGPMSQSTRKSWRLLGVALNLASEARIFSDEPLDSLGFDTRQATRFYRTRKLLYIYVAQMASRLGCTSILPENLNFNSTFRPQDNEPRGRWWDTWMTLWLDLTKLMNSAFVCFSPSGPAMKQVIAGNYDLLHLDWIPSLAHWNERFKSHSSGMPVDLVYLLSIEYHHLEACISALAIQAVVERAAPQSNSQSEISDTQNHRPSMLPDDRNLIDKTVSACCEVLNLATVMQVGGRLRYTPLRTRLCIISASILLLKAISLGGRQHDVKISLGTLDQCIAGLRSCGVDDLDYLPRYAELVDKHLQRFREQFTLLQGQPGQGLTGKEPSRYDWVVRPFNLKIALCSSERKAIPLGISSSSLDFLLELLDSGGK